MVSTLFGTIIYHGQQCFSFINAVLSKSITLFNITAYSNNKSCNILLKTF